MNSTIRRLLLQTLETLAGGRALHPSVAGPVGPLLVTSLLAVLAVLTCLANVPTVNAQARTQASQDLASSDQTSVEPTPDHNQTRPNILVIVADDLGWSDIGAFGGEIRTPVLNSLAARGVMMTQFYVAPTCAPTRSMLMTGVDNHLAGVGVMGGIRAPNQIGRNFEAKLHEDVVTLAEVARASGYRTFLSGKWHLDSEDPSQYPDARGFDRSFSLLTGGASHFSDMLSISPEEIARYVEDGEEVNRLPEEFYSSVAFTDKMLGYLEAPRDQQPFFAYLSYTAPHDPLQVPDAWLDKYQGVYAQGPVATRQARLDRQVELGLIPEGIEIWPYPRFPSWFPNHLPAWSERSMERRREDERPMEIYAAMVELMDQQIGRVFQALEEQGELSNTLVVFFSDNGASSAAPFVYGGVTREWFAENWDNSLARRGQPGNFTVQGTEWASVSVTPWKLYKNSVAEGGIRSPLIVAGPSVAPGERLQGIAHVTDIPASLYELFGVDPMESELFTGKEIPTGLSLRAAWSGAVETPRKQFGVELFGNRAFRDGDWKASLIVPPISNGRWELYNLRSDPGEMQNRAEQEPEILTELQERYAQYKAANGVIHPNPPSLNATLMDLYPRDCDWLCEAKFWVINKLGQLRSERQVAESS
ncbi:MAG: sulfatase-like hydrolase/transferase [Pseudomonadota bacterium]